MRGEEGGCDRLEHIVPVQQDVVVPEAENAISLRLQPACTCGVERLAIQVLAAIHLDDQPCFKADEVRDEWADAVLPTEFLAEHAPVAQ